MSSFGRVISRWWFPVFFLGLATLARAHPLKLSVTEANFNRETGRLELAIRFFSDDLEETLSKDAGKRVPVDKPDALAAAALAYLKKHLHIVSADGAAQTIEWVGAETDKTHIWFYCEAPLPGGVVGARFNVTFMHELYPDQLNSLQLRDGTFKQNLIFVRGTGETTVRPKR